MVKESNGHSCKILTFLAVFCLFRSDFFSYITFGDGFFHFQDNKVHVSLKQAPGQNHEKTIFQPRQCPFKIIFLLIFPLLV